MNDNSKILSIYFQINQYFMSCCGIWPYQSKKSARLIRIFWSFMHISVLQIENIILSIIFSNSIHHQTKIKYLLEKICINWKSLSDKKEQEILFRYSEIGKIISRICIGTTIGSLFFIIVPPMVLFIQDELQYYKGTRTELNLFIQYPIENNEYFYLFLIHALTSGILGIFPLLSLDSFTVNYVQHVCGMFAILGLVDEFNDIVGTSFAIIILILIFLTCTSSIAIFILWENAKEVMRYLLFTFLELLHMFCFAFLSQDLMNHNNKIYKCIFNSGWYKSSAKTGGLIKMMFLRCSRPCLIQCMTYPLTLENFLSVLRHTFSYFMVVRSRMLQKA
ncbi:PREDICTED: putative odorant receptor 69a, isoform A [Ceratosolen solmsi marchali]|uniref:Odorant receptor 69a, isoform A n=1 Tax=Ceratosolen solmsi marchali TaxID=326594 RepID=A0AAJ6YT66_9HYME|nr:PREDICTED: putative odorant receptor 69a, isoform A [Ceratosolen solmsi marchali]